MVLEQMEKYFLSVLVDCGLNINIQITLIVLVAEKRITVFDYKSNSHPSSYPVSNSPLSLLLSEEIDFTKGAMVLDHSYDGSLTQLRNIREPRTSRVWPRSL